MQKVKIHLYISQAVALAARCTSYGDTVYEPTAAELAELSDDEVAVLLPYTDADHRAPSRLSLAVARVDWPTVLSALRASIAKQERQRTEEATKEAERLANREAINLAWLAVDDRKFLDERPLGYVVERGNGGPYWGEDPRVKARFAALEDMAQALTGAKRADLERAYLVRPIESMIVLRNDGWDTTRAADDGRPITPRTDQHWQEAYALAVQRNDAFHSAAREYALGTPELRRAAEDEYEVTKAAVDHVVDALVDACGVDWHLVDGSEEYDAAQWEEREAPSAEAFAVLDRVTSAIEAVPTFAGITVKALRIQRYREDKHEDWRTVVMVQVTPVIGVARFIIVPAELPASSRQCSVQRVPTPGRGYRRQEEPMSVITHPPSHTRIRLPFRPRKAHVDLSPPSIRPGVLLLPWANLLRGTLVRSIRHLDVSGVSAWRVEYARGGLTGLSHWEQAQCGAEPLVSYVATQAEYDSVDAATSEDGVWWHLSSGQMGLLGYERGGDPILAAVYNRAPSCVEQLLVDAYAASERKSI